ncbi:hypothetical protein [Cellulosimicrobium phage DS1]|nr:hypothetical protein [Cellulosimicrobium phage DS1]
MGTPDIFGDLFTPEEQEVINAAILNTKPELKGMLSKPKPEDGPTRRVPGEISQEPIKGEGYIENSGVRVDENTRELLVPEMSADETAENTPARGRQLLRVRPPHGVPLDKFRLVVSNAFALYQLHGAFGTDSLVERTGLTPGIVGKIVTSAEFKIALETRGVAVDPEVRGLTVEQEQALLILTDPTAGPLSKKLKAIGWSYAKYKSNMKHAPFAEQMRGVTEQTLADNSDSFVVLEALALNGDLNAIKYKHLLNGTYDPNRQQNIDVVAIISTVFEAVTKHVKDPEVLQGLAQDLQGIARAVGNQPQQRILEA